MLSHGVGYHDHAELGCLVVEPSYRRQGCGDAMLGFLERTAVAAGIDRVFALSTHTMQWFNERGFAQVAVSELPMSRQREYNFERASKVYQKNLSDTRVLDAEELFWMASLAKSEMRDMTSGQRRKA